jgi:hypothetical protein
LQAHEDPNWQRRKTLCEKQQTILEVDCAVAKEVMDRKKRDADAIWVSAGVR